MSASARSGGSCTQTRSTTIKLDVDLAATAIQVRQALPCSVLLPAGAGKTQTIAAIGAHTADGGERVLVLTHTNAGVDALRRRLRAFGAAASRTRVETIASWAHSLARHYPQLGQLRVPPVPRGSDAERYYAAALLVATSAAIRRVLRASYSFAIVDEYQDCGANQHALVAAVGEILPIAVFGDPLQSIFDFGGNVPVDWSADVTPRWPSLDLPSRPWRWHGQNEELGEWLLDVRNNLLTGGPIVLPEDGPVTWKQVNADTQVSACYAAGRKPGTVVAIANLEHECPPLARRLSGTYGVMEPLEGRRMIAFAAIVDRGDPTTTAVATLKFGRDCMAGVAAVLNQPVQTNIQRGRGVTHLNRPGAERALETLSAILEDPAPARVSAALRAIADIPDVRMHLKEAWHTVLRALDIAAASGSTVEDAVVQVRNRVRVIGRPSTVRDLSRPVLIKGLEYDHAVLLDADVHTATSLYVALTRPRKSLTVLSQNRTIRPVTR